MMKRVTGFSLIEILVAVAIIGVLTAVAVPAYSGYVTRSRLTEAFSALATVQPNAEQYWANNRTFVGFDGVPPASHNFNFALTVATVSAYTVTATGTGTMDGFTYSIDQAGTRVTIATPTYGTSNSCWVDRKGAQCSE